jgi:hypothetical protein
MRPQHTNPEEAVRIHGDVRALRSVACHLATFRLAAAAACCLLLHAHAVRVLPAVIWPDEATCLLQKPCHNMISSMHQFPVLLENYLLMPADAC